nr:MAG TPA: hypothetical protein [Bacteriophage sp.]
MIIFIFLNIDTNNYIYYNNYIIKTERMIICLFS